MSQQLYIIVLFLAVSCRAANIPSRQTSYANIYEHAPRLANLLEYANRLTNTPVDPKQVNVTNILPQPRILIEGEKLYLPCIVTGEFTSCGWNDPHDVIYNPADLDPEGDVTPLPGFNCGIVVKAVDVDSHSGRWTCIATSNQGFDSSSSEITVRPASAWPGSVANVSSPLSGRWGQWGQVEMCPPNAFADSIEVKSEAPTTGDNTAVNGVMIACRQPGGDLPARVTSTVGDFGNWRGEKTCHVPEYVTKFSLRVEPDQGDLGDDTAVDDMKAVCTNYPEDEVVGGGEDWGVWGDWAECPPDTAVCGLQTRVEPYMGLLDDDTILNDVRVFCCPLIW